MTVLTGEIKKEAFIEEDVVTSSPRLKKKIVLDSKSPLIVKRGEKQTHLSFIEYSDENETLPMVDDEYKLEYDIKPKLTKDVKKSIKIIDSNCESIKISKVSRKPRNVKTKRTPQDTLKQTNLDTFAIRRTARQQAKDLEKEKENNIPVAIINKQEEGLKVFITIDKGRGVLSTRFFKEGEFVVEYAGELIAEKEAKEREVEYKKDQEIGSYMFYFQHSDKKWCVDATRETPRLGRLLNHSRMNPNCFVKVFPIDGIPRLAILAKRDIRPGEELVYDYGDRDKESLELHPWLKY